MKRLVVITDTHTIIEYLAASAVETRIQSIMKRHKVITHTVKDVTYQPDKQKYSKIA